MKIVIVESPFATGNVELPDRTTVPVYEEANVEYARACLHDCLVNHHEAPFASHLLYTQPGVLDDDIPEQRTLGINAGFEFAPLASRRVFYLDRGISRGMRLALEASYELRLPCEARMLGGKWDLGWRPSERLLEAIRACGNPRV